MHDYQSFKKLYNSFHVEEKDDCRECPEGKCYRPGEKGLFFDTSETTDIVLISESPYNYPKEGVNSSEDFKNKELQPRLERNGSDVAPPPAGKPKDIFEFIYNTFWPVFKGNPKQSWADAFLESVYWTHVGKKSFKGEVIQGEFKPYSPSERKRYGEQCARQLLLRELQAIQPRMVIIASAIASNILLGSGLQELLHREDYRWHNEGSLLRLEDANPNSLLKDFSGDRTCELAIFPNPSPRAGYWKNLAYDKKYRETMTCKIKTIHQKLENRIC
jgi:hypothetical protein